MNSKEKMLINLKLARVNAQMIKEFGKDNQFWTETIQNTEVYRQILDVETKMYLEGTIYLCDCLIEELEQKGILPI